MNWPTCQIIIYQIFLVSAENLVELAGVWGHFLGFALPLLCSACGALTTCWALPQFSVLCVFFQISLTLGNLQLCIAICSVGLVLQTDEFLSYKKGMNSCNPSQCSSCLLAFVPFWFLDLLSGWIKWISWSTVLACWNQLKWTHTKWRLNNVDWQVCCTWNKN